jgi:hypothetical protein
MSAHFLEVRGKIERDGLVIHVIANELIDLTPRLRALGDGEAELPDPEKRHGEGSWNPAAGTSIDETAARDAPGRSLRQGTR